MIKGGHDEQHGRVGFVIISCLVVKLQKPLEVSLALAFLGHLSIIYAINDGYMTDQRVYSIA